MSYHIITSQSGVIRERPHGLYFEIQVTNVLTVISKLSKHPITENLYAYDTVIHSFYR